MKVELIERESESKYFTKTERERAHVLCSCDTQPRTRFSVPEQKRVLVCTQLMMCKGRISCADIRWNTVMQEKRNSCKTAFHQAPPPPSKANRIRYNNRIRITKVDDITVSDYLEYWNNGQGNARKRSGPFSACVDGLKENTKDLRMGCLCAEI